MNTQVWIHEWLHPVCWFYQGLGYRMPLYDADGAATAGYSPEQPPYAGWGTYYADLMTRGVIEDGVATGIPSEAWARATIRDSMDRVAPETSQTGAGGAWHNKPVIVAFTATDAGSPVSGVFSTRFRVDGGSWRTGTTVRIGAPIDHSNDGLHTLQVSSTDNVGNEEPPKDFRVRIDTLGPTTARQVGRRPERHGHLPRLPHHRRAQPQGDGDPHPGEEQPRRHGEDDSTRDQEHRHLVHRQMDARGQRRLPLLRVRQGSRRECAAHQGECQGRRQVTTGEDGWGATPQRTRTASAREAEAPLEQIQTGLADRGVVPRPEPAPDLFDGN